MNRVRAKEIAKNVIIILLMALMLMLFLLTWSNNPDTLPEGIRGLVSAVDGAFGIRFDAPPVVEGSRADTYGEAVPAAAIAVVHPDIAAESPRSVYGFYDFDGTLDEVYSLVQFTLADCLGSAEKGESIARQEFVDAACLPETVFISYSGEQPLSLLALSQGSMIGDEDHSVSRILLKPGSENVILYYCGSGEYWRAATTVQSSRLSALFEGVEGRKSAYSFVFGFGEEAELSVYPEGEFRLPVITAQPVAMTESAVNGLLSAFGMNAESNYRYVSAEGTQYAVEGGRTLSADADGSVVYTDPNHEGVGLRSDATDAAVIEFCRAIAEAGSAGIVGDGEWSLRGFERTDGRDEVRFGYVVRGIPAYVDGLASAAAFVVENGSLVSAHMTLRRFVVTDETSLMMPPKSAAAVGLKGCAYFDDGSSEVLVPRWSK